MRVGTSNKFCDVLNKIKDHPHACGDKIYITLLRFFDIGSSPCVWGQVRTPFSACRNTGDHPHACGDKFINELYRPAYAGSSPCVWGQAVLLCIYPLILGIIPMRVGTSNNFSFTDKIYQDHPHACGDKSCSGAVIVCMRGSSPCVWGQEKWKTEKCAIIGIIPMRVGTRLKKSRKIAVLQNQPLRFPLTFHRSFV